MTERELSGTCEAGARINFQAALFARSTLSRSKFTAGRLINRAEWYVNSNYRIVKEPAERRECHTHRRGYFWSRIIFLASWLYPARMYWNTHSVESSNVLFIRIWANTCVGWLGDFLVNAAKKFQINSFPILTESLCNQPKHLFAYIQARILFDSIE